ncbi:cytochrome P450 4C1-like isoform X2 [Hyposmocoma kahamanoa]|uniref:cytochrome P450 4C1-like isoform X2 n=1 Tax=Hyposmocoma kahamanoa TaxID=1477025 RepID=UPI000E6D9B4A|nr:cytochrome P450 4C1-like isoform X2 [Hyposmocoma kahamanoa]
MLCLQYTVELLKLSAEWNTKYDGLFGWWMPFHGSVNISRPEDIETVMSSSKHIEKSLPYYILKDWLREGLLLSTGSKWQRRRKILTPAFHFNILKRFFITLEENSQRLIQSLEKSNGKTIDIIPVLSFYTLSAICETAMGTRMDEDGLSSVETYKAAIYKLGKLFIDRFSRPYLMSNIIFNLLPIGKETKRQLKIVKTFTKSVITERKKYIEQNGIKFPEENDEDWSMASKKKKIAMLDLLISAQHEGVIDDEGIQEEVDTFMFEGHDTTAVGLTFCLMLLANNKNVQDKIVCELNEIFGDSPRHATTDDLSSMKYLECCVKESLRLYPPVHFIGRKLEENVTLGGYEIKLGTNCHIFIYNLHRREDLFKNATVFDPDRFLPENSVGRHPYAYTPFSAGSRNCIGQRFAMMEMKSCVAAILRKFELQPVTTQEDVVCASDLVLRSAKPIYVKFIKRNL